MTTAGLALRLLAACAVGLAGCSAVPPAPPPPAGDAWVVVAVADAPEPQPGAGSTPRAAYPQLGGYAGSTRAAALAAEVAAAHGLQEHAFWRIAPLQWRCMLYRLVPGTDRAQLLGRLARDPRVQLAQPLNRFETLATPPAGPLFNDPYVGLQRGFAAIGAGPAQQWSQGEGVRVAVIDTEVDPTHPDLAGRVATRRDYVPGVPVAAGGEQHGTQVAGVIAAAANNRIGIVGVAPQARLLAYRACWPVAGAASACDSFTLAQALTAAIADGADVINLSLGGPADPLLQRLVEHAQRRGAVVVGALPPGGRSDGFPVGVPGVLAVAAEGDMAPAAALAAPGRDILTLAPGGHYGYASGSSLAAAHVSGTVALLRALNPALGAAELRAGLAATPAGHALDACAAVRRLRADAVCAAAP